MGHKKFVSTLVTSYVFIAMFGLLAGFVAGLVFLFEKAGVPFEYWLRILTI